MKKFMVMGAAICLALAMTGCKSSDSAYKQAYEKAKSQEASQRAAEPTPTVTETPVVTPVQTVPATQTRVTDNYDNVAVRQEQVTLVSGAGLNTYSVVVGSFSIIANAEGLQQRLRNAGYMAQIVKNEERNMYRVVAMTSNDKGEAVRSRDALRGTELNPQGDAWLLFSQRY